MIAAPAPILINLKNVGAKDATLDKIGVNASPIKPAYSDIFVPTFPRTLEIFAETADIFVPSSANFFVIPGNFSASLGPICPIAPPIFLTVSVTAPVIFPPGPFVQDSAINPPRSFSRGAIFSSKSWNGSAMLSPRYLNSLPIFLNVALALFAPLGTLPIDVTTPSIMPLNPSVAVFTFSIPFPNMDSAGADPAITTAIFPRFNS